MIIQGSRQGKWPGIILLFVALIVGAAGCAAGRQQPRGRYGAAMVWDAGEDQMILFGGRAKGLFGEKVLNDTWIFNLEDQTWKRLPTRSKPSARLSPGLIFDPESRQLILFGGLGRDQRFGDTWVLDLEKGIWEDITPPVSPSARSDMGLALDGKQNKALLFGGYCQESQREKCAETWIFDLESRTWSEVHPVDSPPVTYGLRLVFDPDNQRFLQWGGHMSGLKDNMVQSLGYADTIWAFSFMEENWIALPDPAGAAPRERYWHHFVADPISGEIILYGGNGGQGFLDDTWTYAPRSNRWQSIQWNDPPPQRIQGAAAFDDSRQKLILFGGVGDDFLVYRDTWIYSAETAIWERIIP